LNKFHYTCFRAFIGSILEALKAGWRLAITETKMTIIDTRRMSEIFITGESISPVCLPKLKVILEILRI
jgi:hypothetical protein